MFGGEFGPRSRLARWRERSYPPRDRGPQDRRTIGGIRIESPFRSVAEVGDFLRCALNR